MSYSCSCGYVGIASGHVCYGKGSANLPFVFTQPINTATSPIIMGHREVHALIPVSLLLEIFEELNNQPLKQQLLNVIRNGNVKD